MGHKLRSGERLGTITNAEFRNALLRLNFAERRNGKGDVFLDHPNPARGSIKLGAHMDDEIEAGIVRHKLRRLGLEEKDILEQLRR